MEPEISLKNIRVLTSLYKEKSLKATARILGKTPSAISKTLAKLREAYDDPLFVTSTNGGEATPRLQSIIEDLFMVQEVLENSLATEVKFDPSLFVGEISLSCSVGLIDHFGEQLFSQLSEQAPQAQIKIVTWEDTTLTQLASNQITAAIHILSDEKPQHIYQKQILDDEIVLALQADHPAQNLQDALTYPAIIIKTSGWNDHRYRFLEKLQQNNVHFVSGGLVDNFSLGVTLIKNTDKVIFLPKAIVPPSLKYFTFSKDFHVPLKFVYCIKNSNRNSQFHQWLYEVCLAVIKA